MNKKTKICVAVISLLLIVLMAAACFPIPASTPSDAGSNATATEEPIESASSVPDETPAPEKSQMPEYAEGTLTDTGYSSEYLGLQWTIPEGSDLVMATQAELTEFTESTLDAALLEDSKNTYEMMASNAASDTNLLVMTEKLPLSNMTIEQYVDVAAKNIAADETYSYDGTAEPVTIAGLDFIKTPMTIDNGDGFIVRQDYYFAKIHDRTIGFILTYMDDSADKAELALTGFQPYAAE